MSRVILHCNAGVAYGMGHFARALTLAECAQSRGWDVLLGGDIDDAAMGRAGSRVPTQAMPRHEVAAWLAGRGADSPHVIHLDSYWPEASEVVPDRTNGGALVSNMQDGSFGTRAADLAIDANLGAEFRVAQPRLARHHLLGVDAAVVRDAVIAERGRWSPKPGLPRLLVALGGTDPHDVTGRVVAALNSVAEPLEVTVVCRPDRAEGVRAMRGPHAITVTGFLEDLPAVAAEHTAVISAAGTAVWDFACMGMPTAILAVAENQFDGYRAAVESGLVVGLGQPPFEDLGDRISELAALVKDADRLRQLSERGMATVDGLGAWRIVSAWETLLGGISSAPTDSVARLATTADADLLLKWRNDPQTRGGSRSADPVPRTDHLAWLERAMASDTCQLFVVERAGVPVGTVRFDRRGATDHEVSITVAPEQRGTGAAAAVLAAGERALVAGPPVRLVASVRESNEASVRLFARAGYLPHLPADADGFTTSIKWRVDRD